MTVVILHHAGDANVPSVRVPGTVALARRYPKATIVVLAGPEADALWVGVGPWGFLRYERARTTVGEIIAARDAADLQGARILISSTEQGHRGRAYLAARIIFAFTGVRVVKADYPGGTYRSPPWEWCRDVLAATWWKLTHRFRAR